MKKKREGKEVCPWAWDVWALGPLGPDPQALWAQALRALGPRLGPQALRPCGPKPLGPLGPDPWVQALWLLGASAGRVGIEGTSLQGERGPGERGLVEVGLWKHCKGKRLGFSELACWGLQV